MTITPSTAEQPPALLTVAKVVSTFGVSRSQVYRWLADGLIEARKIGRSTYVVTSTLQDAIDNLPKFQPGGLH